MKKEIITKEQFNQYLDENWNEHFFKALVQCVKDELFSEEDRVSKEEYRNELKQMVWEACKEGIKEYLDLNFKSLTEDISDQVGRGIVENFNIDSMNITIKNVVK